MSVEARLLTTVPEFTEAVRLQQHIWGFSEIELLPVRLFVVAGKIGGQSFGAYDQGRMVAFTLAIPGLKKTPSGPRPYLHSHMLGVLPEYRDHGLGRLLKYAQRERALADGFDLMEWTFDPLELKNAYFNLERLGAIVRRYVLNQYGTTTSPLHGGMPTDRCIAEWNLIREGRVHAPVEDRIRCDFSVLSVQLEGGRFLISDGKTTIEADRCISTIPLQGLVPALNDVPPAVTDALGRLVYNGVACVFVGLRGRVPPLSWVYLPEPGLGHANRVSFPSNYSTGTAPAGCGSILAECTYRPGDAVAEMDDDALAAHVLDRLEAMGVLRREEVAFTGVARQPFAYVVYDLAYQESVRTVREFVASRGIDLVGRFAEFEYLNMDGCIRHALDYVRGRGPCA
jgi:GNAT superfamily N-acetyltransferase